MTLEERNDFTKPFFVNCAMAKRLGYDRPFYLPALLSPEPQPVKEPPRPQWDRLQQLEGRVIHVENKLLVALKKINSKRYTPPPSPLYNYIYNTIKTDESSEKSTPENPTLEAKKSAT